MTSGAETNLKVGGGAPIRSEAGTTKFLVVPLHFLALKVQLVVLVSAFVMVGTVWSVYCLPPRAQQFVKVGARGPRSPWSRRW